MAKGLSKCILWTTNTLIFLIAGGALGVSMYLFFDAVAKSLTKVSLLTVIGIVSVALMLFSMLGCKAASTPPEKKCSKCMYLTILLVLFLAEFVAAGYVFNLGHALQVAQDKGFDVEGNVTQASENAVVFLHDQLESLYTDEKCTGGAATGTKIPFNFTKVQCATQPVSDTFHTLLTAETVSTEEQQKTFTHCTTDAKFTPAGSNPSDFTQAFCGSEANIVSLAHKYAQYLVWFPALLAGLTFILLVATICLIAQKQQERQRQIRMDGGRQAFQMANP